MYISILQSVHMYKRSSLSKDKQISRSPCSFCLKWKCNPEYSRLNTEPYLGMVQLRLGRTEAPCASPSVGAERGERGHPKTRETWTGFGPPAGVLCKLERTFGSDRLRWAVLPSTDPLFQASMFSIFHNDVWRFFFPSGFNVQARDKSRGW